MPIFYRAATVFAKDINAKRKDGSDGFSDNGVVSNAESMIGAFRDLRQSKDADDYRTMRSAYDSIVQTVI